MKSNIVPPPADKFQMEDLYTRKYWRRVQHLANEFWCRWRKEILLSLQERQKWHLQKRNFNSPTRRLAKIKMIQSLEGSHM